MSELVNLRYIACPKCMTVAINEANKFDGNTSSPNSGLLYNGVYKSKNEFADYLRFFPDGTVLNASIAGQLGDVKRMLVKGGKDISTGFTTIKGNHISFSASSDTGSVDYDGEIDGEQLRLNFYSYINQVKGEDIYTFIKW